MKSYTKGLAQTQHDLQAADEIQSDKVIVFLKASCSVGKMLEANKMDFIMHYT